MRVAHSEHCGGDDGCTRVAREGHQRGCGGLASTTDLKSKLRSVMRPPPLDSYGQVGPRQVPERACSATAGPGMGSWPVLAVSE